MNYYIIDKQITVKSELDLSLNGYKSERLNVLTKSQYDFSIANPQATLEEVLNEKMNEAPEHIPSLEELKGEKLNELNTHFETIFANGYADETTEWTLFCGESNVLDYATLKNAIMDMDEAQVVEIGTFTGWQTSTKAVVYPLLKRYSAYMLPLTTTYRKLRTNIEYCDTKENLELIVW